MKIPNYEPYSVATGYRQEHACMPDDVFQMLICGPTNSGKTNILIHMLNELLFFDKAFIFSKNLHQRKYRDLLRFFEEKINPAVGYDVIEAAGDEITPLDELPVDNQKVVVFDDLVCERNQSLIIEYFITGRHRNCSVIYLTQSFFKTPKNIRDNCSHFCLFNFRPRENKQIAADLGISHELLEKAFSELYSFLYYDKPRKSIKKNFDEPL